MRATKSKPTPAAGNGGNLARWLTDPRTVEFFGPSFALKAEVLAAVIQGGNLAAVARRHGVTRHAASKQGRRATAIYGDLKSPS